MYSPIPGLVCVTVNKSVTFFNEILRILSRNLVRNILMHFISMFLREMKAVSKGVPFVTLEREGSRLANHDPWWWLCSGWCWSVALRSPDLG